ncbi:MAG: hypothetical protein HDS65_07235 [Bacteroidales bacterium]|nr:hypothetical protein [Bacteroidales bacterium]
MKRLTALCIAAAALSVYGQQTIFESNILSRAHFAGGTVDVPEALTDGNDMTVATLSGDLSAEYIFDTPVTVTGVNVVAAADLNTAPSRVYVYARNNDSEDWKIIVRVMATGYKLPYTNATARATTDAPYTQFKIEVNKVNNGGGTAQIAEIQLLGRDFSRVVYPENPGTATVAKQAYDNGVIGDNAWTASLQYDLDEPLVIGGYTLGGAATGNKTTRPAAWELQASNDGEDWVTLDMQANMPDIDVQNFALEYTFGKSGRNIDFSDALDKIHAMMDQKFYKDYNGGKYLIHAWNTVPADINNGYNYWWMAHAVDAYVDAYRRTGKNTYESHARNIRTGMYVAYDAGRRDLWNSFFDDMDWMCLACIRASETLRISPKEWFNEAVQLFDWIWNEGWDASVGGILWNHGSAVGTVDSKNACSNAPAMLCAALLYQKTGEEHYLEKAEKIYEFMLAHNLFEDGFVKDSPAQENRGWAFTYNQGTWVGGLLELYRATKNQEYYDVAVDLLDKSIDSRWYSPNGIMCESGKGDGGLFKGIYIRYITDWVLSGLLDEEHQIRYTNYLLENARSLYLAALVKPDMTIMANWQDRGEAVLPDYHASVVLSGLFLFESVERLRAADLLNEDYSVKNPNHGKAFSHYRIKVTENHGGGNVEISSFGLLDSRDDEAGVSAVAADNSGDTDDRWYTLTGICIEKPSAPGIYIHNKKKIIIR